MRPPAARGCFPDRAGSTNAWFGACATHGTAGVTIVAQALMPGSTAAVAQTATPVVRSSDRAKPAASTRIAVVSDDVQNRRPCDRRRDHDAEAQRVPKRQRGRRRNDLDVETAVTSTSTPGGSSRAATRGRNGAKPE